MKHKVYGADLAVDSAHSNSDHDQHGGEDNLGTWRGLSEDDDDDDDALRDGSDSDDDIFVPSIE